VEGRACYSPGEFLKKSIGAREGTAGEVLSLERSHSLCYERE